jgi:hypothetical protein
VLVSGPRTSYLNTAATGTVVPKAPFTISQWTKPIGSVYHRRAAAVRQALHLDFGCSSTPSSTLAVFLKVENEATGLYFLSDPCINCQFGGVCFGQEKIGVLVI